MICYDEYARFGSGFQVNVDPTRLYLNHYSNYLYLTFLASKSTDRMERLQALKEIVICERKLEFWKRKPKFNMEKALLEIVELKKQWA